SGLTTVAPALPTRRATYAPPKPPPRTRVPPRAARCPFPFRFMWSPPEVAWATRRRRGMSGRLGGREGAARRPPDSRCRGRTASGRLRHLGCTELVQGMKLDLAHALPRHAELSGNGLDRERRPAAEPEAQLDHEAAPGRQPREARLEQVLDVLLEEQVDRLVRGGIRA